MSVDILGTSWDQCWSVVQYSFTSTETRRLVRTDSHLDSHGTAPELSNKCVMQVMGYIGSFTTSHFAFLSDAIIRSITTDWYIYIYMAILRSRLGTVMLGVKKIIIKTPTIVYLSVLDHSLSFAFLLYKRESSRLGENLEIKVFKTRTCLDGCYTFFLSLSLF